MRAQEAAVEAAGPGADQGGDAPGASGRYVAGGVHGGRGAAHAHRHLPVLAPAPESEEADRRGILAACAPHDDESHDQAVPAARRGVYSGLPADGATGCRGRDEAAADVPGAVPSGAPFLGGRCGVPAAAHRQRDQQLRGGELGVARDHGLCELLHAAVDHHREPELLVAEGRILVLQRGHFDAAAAADERRAGDGEAEGLRRVQRAGCDAERELSEGAEIRARRRAAALLPVQLPPPSTTETGGDGAGAAVGVLARARYFSFRLPFLRRH